MEQMVDIYGVACDVHLVRTFHDGRQLGVGYDLREPATWFVYDREAGALANGQWHKHCGSYSTFEHAEEWILNRRTNRHGLLSRAVDGLITQADASRRSTR